MRSTRIRTFYDSIVTMPNSILVTTKCDNYSKRRYRRWKQMVSINYATPPEKISAFCEGIRELLRAHPYTRKDYYQVWLNGFAGSSLDVLVYVFWSTPDWPTELRERHRFMLDIIRLAGDLGIEFAYPFSNRVFTQRRKLGKGSRKDFCNVSSGLDEENQRTKAGNLWSNLQQTTIGVNIFHRLTSLLAQNSAVM